MLTKVNCAPVCGNAHRGTLVHVDKKCRHLTSQCLEPVSSNISTAGFSFTDSVFYICQMNSVSPLSTGLLTLGPLEPTLEVSRKQRSSKNFRFSPPVPHPTSSKKPVVKSNQMSLV